MTNAKLTRFILTIPLLSFYSTIYAANQLNSIDKQSSDYFESDSYETQLAQDTKVLVDAVFASKFCERLPEARIKSFEPITNIAFENKPAGLWKTHFAYVHCERKLWVNFYQQGDGNNVATIFKHFGITFLNANAFNQTFAPIKNQTSIYANCPNLTLLQTDPKTKVEDGNWIELWTFSGCSKIHNAAISFKTFGNEIKYSISLQ